MISADRFGLKLRIVHRPAYLAVALDAHRAFRVRFGSRIDEGQIRAGDFVSTAPISARVELREFNLNQGPKSQYSQPPLIWINR
jgi:hypothetical protein